MPPRSASEQRAPWDVPAARRELDSGVQVNCRFDDGGGDTPLAEAAGFGHPGIVGLLLSRGVSVNTPNLEGKTALWEAADSDLVRSNDTGPYASTPAKTAAQSAAYVRIIRLLLAHEGDPNVSDNRSVTPLGVAAFRGRAQGVQALLEGRAAPNRRDGFGRTPLEWASYNSYPQIVQMLIAYGARPHPGRRLPGPGQHTRDAAHGASLGFSATRRQDDNNGHHSGAVWRPSGQTQVSSRPAPLPTGLTAG